jgi:hypothetical protein
MADMYDKTIPDKYRFFFEMGERERYDTSICIIFIL